MKNKSPVPLRIISPICLLVWMGLIFFLSSQTATESAAVSGRLIERVIRFVIPSISASALENIISVGDFFVRKGAHFSLYAILGIFSFLSIITYEKINLFFRFLISALIGVGYSVSDEYHQTFIEGRSGELRDVLIDSAGVLCGILLSLIIYSIKLKRGYKMRKKHYIALTEDLQRRLHSEKLKTEELENENLTLTREITALNSELFHLREKITELESNHAAECTEPEEISEPETTKETEFPEDINIGAKIIGKTVLASAEYCNKLTGVGATPAAKELVNLILGRTEVAKAEILRLSNLDIDYTAKKTAMENEYTETLDYFKSVMAQK